MSFRLSSVLPRLAAFLAAAGVSYVAANSSVALIEDRSEIGVRRALDDRQLTWAEVTADGLQVTLTGTAPTEALRFQALSTAGSVVDAARLIDTMQVEAQANLAPPRFSAEILRNDAGVSIIGLVPAKIDRDVLRQQFRDLSRGQDVTDLLESANYPVPEGWSDALSFAMTALTTLPRAKVSIEAGRVAIKAIAQDLEEKRALERELRRAVPPGLALQLDIAAPRPVLTPFTLRFVIDQDGARFDACSADSNQARAEIMRAASSVGMTRAARCTVGMGVPTPMWSTAARQGIEALAELGGGSITFSDADISLRAMEGTDQASFDRIVGRLENELPDVFALSSTLPEKIDPDQGPPEFVATLSPEGLVQLRGRIDGSASRSLATSYAKSLFGSDVVTTSARIVDDLPKSWQTRVLTGLEALGSLSNGAVVVTPDTMRVTGNTGDEGANARVAQMLADKLGGAGEFELKILYQEKLDPVASLPTPDECEAEIAAILEARKISFEPGSATIDESALGLMDDISEILKKCGDLKLEIQGHTDSQGREQMNLELSQERAQSVLNELRARRVLTGSFKAQGYGESTPIADNGTEEGREANRRIEFRLLRPKALTEEDTSTLESLAQPIVEAAPQSSNGEAQSE